MFPRHSSFSLSAKSIQFRKLKLCGTLEFPKEFPEILVWAQQRRARELQEAMLEVLDKEA
mgnify:CR=1 FL=1